jgi:hypothetical protein
MTRVTTETTANVDHPERLDAGSAYFREIVALSNA